MSQPFAHTSGPRDAKIVFVGEAWGESEEAQKRPFVGYSGKEFWRMLGEAFPDVSPEQHAWACKCINSDSLFLKERERWLYDAGILLTNVFALRPPANNLEFLCCSKKDLPSGYNHPPLTKGKYLRPEYFAEVSRFNAELSQVQPNLVVALGNTALWATCNSTNIGSVRGTTSTSRSGLKVLPTYHPAAVMRQWAWRVIVVGDLMKARREAEFPEVRRPERHVMVNPTMAEIREFRDCYAAYSGPMAVDIETKLRQITMIGFAPRKDSAIVVPFVDLAREGRHYWATLEEELEAAHLVQSILAGPSAKVFQNGLYDLQYLWRYGFRPRNMVHDTMLLHHSMFPELQKSLGFMGSVYTDEPAWKLMRHSKEETKANE